MQRPILIEPDPRLRQLAQVVPADWSGLAGLVQDLADTLAASGGIGLAAPQIGEPWRVVAIDLSASGRAPLVLVNPVIVHRQGQAEIEEGCLSVPGRRIRVPRSASIRVRHDGGQMNASGLLAICIQHELDHLDGRLIIDQEHAGMSAPLALPA